MGAPLMLLLLLLLCGPHTCSAAAGWCYTSQKLNGIDCLEPCSWGTQSSTCDGKLQSPIAISTKNAKINEQLKPFTFQGYNTAHHVEIQNNGHSVQATLSSENIIEGGGLPGKFQAAQFHLHWGNGTDGGSEHLIDSVRYPAELHIVHKAMDSSDGAQNEKFTYAVLAFFYKVVTNDNPQYASLIAELEKIAKKDSKIIIPDTSLKNLIPDAEKLNRYFRYNGSLTTPSCNESVIWTVFEEEIELSLTQIRAFYDKLYFPDGNIKMHNNYRPVQELRGRIVQRSSASIPIQGATIFVTSAFAYLVTALQH